MACEGYEHDSVVVALTDLPRWRVRRGMSGTVVAVDRPGHRIDVRFSFGVANGLPAHAFRLRNPGETLPGPAGSTPSPLATA